MRSKQFLRTVRSACVANGGTTSISPGALLKKKGRRCKVPRRQLPIDEGLWRTLRMVEPPVCLHPLFFLAGHALASNHELWAKGAYTCCGLCGTATYRPVLLQGDCQAAVMGPHCLSAYQLAGQAGSPLYACCKKKGSKG